MDVERRWTIADVPSAPISAPTGAASTRVESVRARGRAAHAGHDQALDAPTRLCGRRGGRHEPGGNQSLSWRPLEHSRTALSLSSWLSSTCTTRGNIVARSPPCLEAWVSAQVTSDFWASLSSNVEYSMISTCAELAAARDRDSSTTRGSGAMPRDREARRRAVVGAVKNCLGPRAGVKGSYISIFGHARGFWGRRACGRRRPRARGLLTKQTDAAAR